MASIVFYEKELPNLVKKLYKLVNMPDRCFVDKKEKSEFVIINTSKEKVISIHKLCRHHELKRRKILWSKRIKK